MKNRVRENFINSFREKVANNSYVSHIVFNNTMYRSNHNRNCHAQSVKFFEMGNGKWIFSASESR